MTTVELTTTLEEENHRLRAELDAETAKCLQCGLSIAERVLRPLGDLLEKETRYQAELLQAARSGEPYAWLDRSGERHELTDKDDIRRWKEKKYQQCLALRHLLRSIGEQVPEARSIVRGHLERADALVERMRPKAKKVATRA